MSEKKQLGKILLRQRALSPEELDRALADNKGGRLASRLAASGAISDVAALKALSEQHGIPGIDLSQICLRLEDLDLLPREIAEKHLILPVLVRDDVGQYPKWSPDGESLVCGVDGLWIISKDGKTRRSISEHQWTVRGWSRGLPCWCRSNLRSVRLRYRAGPRTLSRSG